MGELGGKKTDIKCSAVNSGFYSSAHKVLVIFAKRSFKLWRMDQWFTNVVQPQHLCNPYKLIFIIGRFHISNVPTCLNLSVIPKSILVVLLGSFPEKCRGRRAWVTHRGHSQLTWNLVFVFSSVLYRSVLFLVYLVIHFSHFFVVFLGNFAV